LENPEDKTKVYLIYANVTYDDILLKVPIDNLCYLNFVLISSAIRVHISGRFKALPVLFPTQV
jgi:NAD(P)H-flavin reductase